MAKCEIGQTEYKGICVPDYYTTEQKETAYQKFQADREVNAKKGKKLAILAGVILAVGVVIALLA